MWSLKNCVLLLADLLWKKNFILTGDCFFSGHFTRDKNKFILPESQVSWSKKTDLKQVHLSGPSIIQQNTSICKATAPACQFVKDKRLRYHLPRKKASTTHYSRKISKSLLEYLILYGCSELDFSIKIQNTLISQTKRHILNWRPNFAGVPQLNRKNCTLEYLL